MSLAVSIYLPNKPLIPYPPIVQLIQVFRSDVYKRQLLQLSPRALMKLLMILKLLQHCVQLLLRRNRYAIVRHPAVLRIWTTAVFLISLSINL